MPVNLPANKVNAKLVLKLTEDGIPVSENEYHLVLARKTWNISQISEDKEIVLLDKDGMKSKFDFLQIKYKTVSSVKELVDSKQKATLCIISGLKECTDEEKEMLRSYQFKGGRLLLLNSKEVAKNIYPEYITNWIIPTEGDIVNMERNDASVFDEIDVLELRYFSCK